VTRDRFQIFGQKASSNRTVQNIGLCIDESTEQLHHPDNTEQRRKQITEQSMQPSTAVYAAEDRADALGRGCGAANREHRYCNWAEDNRAHGQKCTYLSKPTMAKLTKPRLGPDPDPNSGCNQCWGSGS
jgi:hypothetical protein